VGVALGGPRAVRVPGGAVGVSSNHTPPPSCRKCHVPMSKSTAIANTLVAGMADFPGEEDGVVRAGATLSYGGPGRVVPCWKCPKCGHSITREGT
jgi:hypothetical protein